ncbi:GNAT family N-acetyltransferase, partial [Streptococcus suis]
NPKQHENNKQLEIHLATFEGLFLTYLGKGFLKNLYTGYLEHPSSERLLITQDNNVVGFLASSKNISAFYKWLLKNK